jgi:glycyl-tRNA synthetase
MTTERYKPSMDALASLCKRRGFIFQNSEIYGGFSGFWDYGPLGAELKRNVRNAWWTDVVERRENIVGLDASIIMHPRVWEASGHIGGFSDPMTDCRDCKSRHRADQLCEEQGMKLITHEDGSKSLPDGVVCEKCKSTNLTPPRDFNLMFQTFVGPVQDESSVAYLRPETAQGIFAQFQNVLTTSRQKVPFGIAQIGKAFRNEVTPRNYTFRSREFEQMELEFFIEPGTDEDWHAYWIKERLAWYKKIGLPEESLSTYEHEELAHYASACFDIMFDFPFGVQELEGIAARGNFDLTQHAQYSKKDLSYFDQEKNEKYLPHVIEPSAGVDRICLALLCDAYREEWIEKETGKVTLAEPGKQAPDGFEARTVLGFAPCIAPIKVAVFPLLKNKPELVEKARGLFASLQKHFACTYDQVGAIGRRYRRQDEIGTPFCVTVDFDSLEDDTVTLRHRDSMTQERVALSDLTALLQEQIGD